jgi:hypothetical protein
MIKRITKAEGKAALLNLSFVIDLIEEANATDHREAGKIIAWHARDCKRSIDTVKAAGLELPGYVIKNERFLKTQGWI